MERSEERDDSLEGPGLHVAILAVALLGHLLSYVAWFDEIGSLAATFALPLALAAAQFYGVHGALWAVLWALAANLLLGLVLGSGDPHEILTDGSSWGLMAALAVGAVVLGRQRDQSRRIGELERLHAEAERRVVALSRSSEGAALQERLARSERMASVGALAQGVAHEINNPLTYVIGNLYYAVEELSRARDGASPGLGKDLDELLRDALDGAERVRRIVRDLERFSREGDEGEQRVDVAAAIDMATNLVRNEMRHRARLDVQVGSLPRVAGSQPRLVQALVNLLMNAAQAIPEGNAAVERIEVAARLCAGRVAIDIRDTGVGMAPEVCARIFDPLFTTKPVGVGTGLGLSVTRDIIQSMGGEMHVESAAGQGSTFTVSLPLHPSEPVSSRDSLRPQALEERLRLLVIDDEPKVGISLARMLRRHELVVLSDSREALRLLQHDRGFDAVLCDLMMPDLTGMDLHQEIAGLDPDFARRFVFMTGGAFTLRAREFIKHTPNITLEKPFERRELRAAIADTRGGLQQSEARASGAPRS